MSFKLLAMAKGAALDLRMKSSAEALDVIDFLVEHGYRCREYNRVITVGGNVLGYYTTYTIGEDHDAPRVSMYHRRPIRLEDKNNA